MKNFKNLLILTLILTSFYNSAMAGMKQFFFDAGASTTNGGTISFCNQICQGGTIWVKNFSEQNTGTQGNPCLTNNAQSYALTGTVTIRRTFSPFTLLATYNCTNAPGGSWNYGEYIPIALSNTALSGNEGGCSGYASIDINYTPSANEVTSWYCNSAANYSYAIIFLKTYAQPIANAGSDRNICQPGQTVTLTAGGVGTPNWTGTGGYTCNNCPTINVTPLTTTTYTLTVTNSSGCSSTDQAVVNVTTGTSVSNFSLTGILVSNGLSHTAVAPNPPTGVLCASNLTIDASATTCETHYWLGVQECDVNGNRTYQYEWGTWFQGEAPSSINLQQKATGSSAYWINGPANRIGNTLFGGNLAVAPYTARYYRVGICTDQPSWTCRDMLIQVDGNCRIGKVTELYNSQNQTIGNLSLYPNPNNGSFKITLTNSDEVIESLIVTDLSGRKVNALWAKDTDGTVSLKAQDISNGIYIVNVTTATQKISAKFSVQK